MKDYFRPLKITHEWLGYSPDDAFETKVQRAEARIKEIKAEGYGGIVTNVHFVRYLKDPDEWALMKEKVRLCKENDMRMWLYDEDGYPSGSAGGETIAANPDYEARAAVVVSKILAPGESWTSTVPYGHEKPISAFGYYMQGESITDEELLSKNVQKPDYNDGFAFNNDSDNKNLLCLAFYQKHMFEGGHCEHNCCSARRYFDISNGDAVKEFINNTYKRYAETVGEFFSPFIGHEGENSVIEAIFTDEPSYMGFYLNHALIAPRTTNEPDKEIVLYPVILWGKNFANRFASINGYRIEDNMPALFLGNGEAFRKVRRDFYEISTLLLEESFFAQISDYCASAGLSFSGHILLEDYIHDHVPFEGNFFKLLRHMHIPGIDMLHSLPESVWCSAFTPLLVSSIASLYNKPHVMDEVSAHAQGGNVTIDQIYISLMLQYALGADVFTSYYGEHYPVEAQQKLFDSISFVQQETQNKAYRGTTLLYYPIETMMQLRKPDHDIKEAENPSPALIDNCEKALFKAMYSLLSHQVPFHFCDTDTLKLAAKKGPKAFIISPCLIDDALVSAAKALHDNGCRVIYYCDPAADNAEFANEYDKIKDFALLAKSSEEATAMAADANGGALTSGNTDGVAAMWLTDGVFLANSTCEERTVVLEKLAPETATDPLTKATSKVSYTDGKATVKVPAYSALIVK